MKLKLERYIGTIALIVGIYGLLVQFLFHQLTSENFHLFHLLKVINLRYLDSIVSNFRIGDESYYLNLFNILFLTLPIIGGLLYFLNKRENRLLRFSFSVIFLARAVAIMFTFFFLLLGSKPLAAPPFSQVALGVVINAAWMFISYQILQELHRISVVGNLDEGSASLKDASKLKRLINLVIDITLCLLIFSSYLFIFRGSTIAKMVSNVEPRGFLWLNLIFYRLIYYVFFETILGATPAKFITGTYVVNLNGEKPGLKTIFIRTVSRFVPFELFSFLGKKGWHDDWSNTRVVDAENKGLASRWYALLVPFFLLVIGGIYIYFSWQDAVVDSKFKDYTYQRAFEAFEKQLAAANPNDVIQLKRLDGYYSSIEYLLKVEEVKKDSLRTLIVPMKNFYKIDFKKIKNSLTATPDSLATFWARKADLLESFEGDSYSTIEVKPFKLTGIEGAFSIKKMFDLHQPLIQNRGTGSMSTNNGKTFMRLDMTISGYSGTLIELKTIEGEMEWGNKLPMYLDLSDRNSRTFSLNIENYTRGTPYKAIFKIKDEIGLIQSYTVEGTNMRRIVTKY